MNVQVIHYLFLIWGIWYLRLMCIRRFPYWDRKKPVSTVLITSVLFNILFSTLIEIETFIKIISGM